MPAIKPCDNITEPLLKLLQSTKDGKTQVPDFQRSWVWNDEQTRSILASISLSYQTPLSAKTNKIIGSNAPSVYLSNLQKQRDITEECMDEILLSHVIDSVALRLDNFEVFFQAR